VPHHHLREFTAKCPKLRSVDEILDEQLRARDFMGRPAKGIILASNNETALVIHKVSPLPARAGDTS
jgi:hypothetical protein